MSRRLSCWSGAGPSGRRRRSQRGGQVERREGRSHCGQRLGLADAARWASEIRPGRDCLMATSSNQLVQKLWNFCNVLRDDGVSTIEYVEQLTYLLFLKMADE